MVGDSAGSDWQLWGTFSVGDHLRARAFVAEALIYDRLIVPVPPTGDPALWQEWETRRDPNRQRKLLDVLEKGMPGLVHEVEWTSSLDQAWLSFAKKDRRFLLASDAADDVRRAQGLPLSDPDTFRHFQERSYLVDFVDPKHDAEMRGAVPPGGVQIVAAYGSRVQFDRDSPAMIGTEADNDTTLLTAFAWPLLVPSSSRRSDTDLLKEAVELARLDTIRDSRAAFHRWRRDLPAGTTPKQARDQLETIIEAYGAAVRKTKIRTRLRMAVLIGIDALGGALGALVAGPLGGAFASGGSSSLTRLVEAREMHTRVESRMWPGVLFHDARERLGWRRP